jgi:hypothetical protein
MADLFKAVQELQQQRNYLQAQLSALDTAISLLSSSTQRRAGRGGPRRMSAAARQRIAAAQRARWAKWKKRRKA